MKDILVIIYESLISNEYIHDMTYNSDSEEYPYKVLPTTRNSR